MEFPLPFTIKLPLNTRFYSKTSIWVCHVIGFAFRVHCAVFSMRWLFQQRVCNISSSSCSHVFRFDEGQPNPCSLLIFKIEDLAHILCSATPDFELMLTAYSGRKTRCFFLLPPDEVCSHPAQSLRSSSYSPPDFYALHDL